MANRNFPNGGKLYSPNVMPVQLTGTITMGSGTIASSSGKMIKSITRLAAGQFQVILQDNYNALISFSGHVRSPVAGSAVAGGAFSVGTVYQIVTLGSTTQAQFVAAGMPSQVTAAPGVIFKAATVGAGSGTVKALGPSGITTVEPFGVPSTEIAPNPNVAAGSILFFQTLGATDASTTTLVAADPASGSIIAFSFILNNSSVP